MPRPSTILRLPPEVRQALDRWLDEPGATQTEATERTNALLAERYPEYAPVSRRAVNRYCLSGRGLSWWDAGARQIARESGRGTADDARSAGKAMGQLIGSRLPAELWMHCFAALAAELANSANSDRSRKGRK